jgi:Putative metallopeptidase
MFTKTTVALALMLGTASNALAATRHQHVAPSYDASEAHVARALAGRRDLSEFVLGNMLFVGFHELGHALVAELRLPVLGRDEAAADSFATMALLEEGTEFSVNVLLQAVRGWLLMDRRDRKLGEAHDAHDLDRQRAFEIVCLMVGSDQKQFKELADRIHLPEDRQQGCRYDYESAKNSWHSVLDGHRRSADQANSPVAVVHGEGNGKLDAFAHSFRSVGFVEALAEYVSSRYVLPHPITLAMKSCGDANASWEPATLTETLCYELAEDFVELYQGYTKKAASQKKTLVDELMTRNVKRIHLAASEPRADQVEKLDLRIETAVSFTQRPSSRAAVYAKAQSRK